MHHDYNFNTDIRIYNNIVFATSVGQIFQSFCGTRAFTIKNIDRCELNSFDTVVIGHLRELGNIMHRNLKVEMLEFCLSHYKNAFCLDDTDAIQFVVRFEEKGLQLFFPERMGTYIGSKNGKLYQLATPSLLILGTNKKQGKFTFQMQVKQLLQKQGYNIGQISTEPTGALFGCECVLPYGYEGIFTPDNIMSIEYINERAFEIDKKQLDLNIIGFQSCFLSRNFYNKGETDLNSLAILYATQPDAAILAIDYSDTTEFINRNINALKALTDTAVIAVALNKYNAVYDYEIDSLKQTLTTAQIEEVSMRVWEAFQLPTFVIGDTQANERLLACIENYFVN